MDELQKMKIMWADINQRLTSVEEENRKLMLYIQRNNYKTAKDKLIIKYRRFIIVEILMVFVVILFLTEENNVVEKYRWPTIIYWILYFIAELIFDFYLLYKVKDIDVINDTVHSIYVKAKRNWKIHKIGIICGLPFAFGLVVLYSLYLGVNRFIVYGIICGAILGLMIGIYNLRKFSLYYRDLQQ